GRFEIWNLQRRKRAHEEKTTTYQHVANVIGLTAESTRTMYVLGVGFGLRLVGLFWKRSRRKWKISLTIARCWPPKQWNYSRRTTARWLSMERLAAAVMRRRF